MCNNVFQSKRDITYSHFLSKNKLVKNSTTPRYSVILYDVCSQCLRINFPFNIDINFTPVYNKFSHLLELNKSINGSKRTVCEYVLRYRLLRIDLLHIQTIHFIFFSVIY